MLKNNSNKTRIETIENRFSCSHEAWNEYHYPSISKTNKYGLLYASIYTKYVSTDSLYDESNYPEWDYSDSLHVKDNEFEYYDEYNHQNIFNLWESCDITLDDGYYEIEGKINSKITSIYLG